MIREGRVSSVDNNKIKVFFPDKDNMTSDDLFIVVPIDSNFNTNDTNFPYISINDRVLIGYTNEKQGYIIGKIIT